MENHDNHPTNLGQFSIPSMAPSSLDDVVFSFFPIPIESKAYIGDVYGNEMSGDRDLP